MTFVNVTIPSLGVKALSPSAFTRITHWFVLVLVAVL